jgi:hypothetical protein
MSILVNNIKGISGHIVPVAGIMATKNKQNVRYYSNKSVIALILRINRSGHYNSISMQQG